MGNSQKKNKIKTNISNRKAIVDLDENHFKGTVEAEA